MTKFAEGTTVPVEKSRAEIEGLLKRYGAGEFFSGWKDTSAEIGFRAKERFVKFSIEMPPRTDRRFTHQKFRGRIEPVSPERVAAAWAQEERRRWRALLLVIKAKLEAIDSGISTFEREFLAFIMLPDGTSVVDAIAPQPRDRVVEIGPGLGALKSKRSASPSWTVTLPAGNSARRCATMSRSISITCR
jgi:hypothetical protein